MKAKKVKAKKEKKKSGTSGTASFFASSESNHSSGYSEGQERVCSSGSRMETSRRKRRRVRFIDKTLYRRRRGRVEREEKEKHIQNFQVKSCHFIGKGVADVPAA